MELLLTKKMTKQAQPMRDIFHFCHRFASNFSIKLIWNPFEFQFNSFNEGDVIPGNQSNNLYNLSHQPELRCTIAVVQLFSWDPNYPQTECNTILFAVADEVYRTIVKSGIKTSFCTLYLNPLWDENRVLERNREGGRRVYKYLLTRCQAPACKVLHLHIL